MRIQRLSRIVVQCLADLKPYFGVDFAILRIHIHLGKNRLAKSIRCCPQHVKHTTLFDVAFLVRLFFHLEELSRFS